MAINIFMYSFASLIPIMNWEMLLQCILSAKSVRSMRKSLATEPGICLQERAMWESSSRIQIPHVRCHEKLALLPGTARLSGRGRIHPEGTPEPVRHETPSKQPEECLRLNFSSLLGNICPTLWLGKGMWGGEEQGSSDQGKWSSPGGSCYWDV